MKKRIFSILAMAIVAIVASFSIKAQEITMAELREAVTLMNKELPSDLGDGLTFKSVALNDQSKNMVFNFGIGKESGVTAPLMGMMGDYLKSMMMDSFKTDPDMKSIFSLLKNKGYGVKMVFTDFNKDSFSIDVKNSEL